MANTLTNVNTVKVFQSALAALKHYLDPLSMFSVAYDSEPAAIGETVYVPVISAQSAGTGTTDYESGDGSAVSVAVTISTNYSRSNHLTAVEASKTQTDAFQKWMDEAIASVAAGVLKGVYDIVDATFTNTGVVTAAQLDADKLLDLRRIALATLKFRPEQPINAVFESEYIATLLKDPAVRDRSASGLDSGISGKVARWAGMNIWESTALADATTYAAAATGISLRGFICQPSCIGVTVRPPKILGGVSYDVVENVTDPETGIGFQYRQWVAPKSNTLWGCVETLFGAKEIDVSRLYSITAV